MFVMLIGSCGLLKAMGVPSKPELLELVSQAEKKEKLPSGLLRAIIHHESGFKILAFNSSLNPGTAISSYGLGQLTLDTAMSYCNLTEELIFDPKLNIPCSAKVLKSQLNRYGGDIKTAIAAYQWGTPCRCDGQKYMKRNGIKGTPKPCQRWVKNEGEDPRLEVLACEKKGRFFGRNDHYVRTVAALYKRYSGRTIGESIARAVVKPERRIAEVTVVEKPKVVVEVEPEVKQASVAPNPVRAKKTFLLSLLPLVVFAIVWLSTHLPARD